MGGDLKYANEFNGIKVAAAFGVTNGRAADVGSVAAPPPDDVRRHGLSLSVMHIASGLFLQGSTAHARTTFFDALNDPVARTKSKHVHIQGGLARNWFGFGNTVVYGEYARGRTDMPSALLDIVGSYRGVGVVQNIDAAAMELYLGYRQFKSEFDGSAYGSAGLGLKDFDLVTAGARIKF